LQKRLDVIPDMTTLGKYIGGGASFGAFGGRGDIMALFDPTSPSALPHAGTFNNNVMSMAAGYAGLCEVFTPEAADALFERGENFRERLNRIAKERKVALQAIGCGSIFGIHTLSHSLNFPADLVDPQPDKKTLIHLEMVLRGFVYAQRGYMTLSLAMTDQDLDDFASAFDEVLSLHSDLLSG
jgi:glutamate-1-semialdehyde 2,1-aminomutase